MHKRMTWLSLLTSLSLLLNACGPAATTIALPTNTLVPQPTPTPRATRVPPTKVPPTKTPANFHPTKGPSQTPTPTETPTVETPTLTPYDNGAV